MSVPKDDPRLTAYALGELNGEDRREFEALLGRDAEARAQVAAIRETGAWLERELAGRSAPALSPRRRARIVAAAACFDAGPPVRAPSPSRERPRQWVLLAALILPALVAALALVRQSLMTERTAPTVDASGAADVAAERATDPRGPNALTHGQRSAAKALEPMPPAALTEPQKMTLPDSDERHERDGSAAPTPERAALPSEPLRRDHPRLETSGVAAIARENDSEAEADDVGAEGGLVGGVVGGLVGGVVGGAGPLPVRSTGPQRLTARAGQSLLAIDPNVSPYKVELPEEYVQHGEEYHATITICVAPDGTVSSVEVLKPSIPIIDRQIPEVVPLWKYRPYLVDGKPTGFCYSTNYRVVRGP